MTKLLKVTRVEGYALTGEGVAITFKVSTKKQGEKALCHHLFGNAGGDFSDPYCTTCRSSGCDGVRLFKESQP